MLSTEKNQQYQLFQRSWMCWTFSSCCRIVDFEALSSTLVLQPLARLAVLWILKAFLSSRLRSVSAMSSIWNVQSWLVRCRVNNAVMKQHLSWPGVFFLVSFVRSSLLAPGASLCEKSKFQDKYDRVCNCRKQCHLDLFTNIKFLQPKQLLLHDGAYPVPTSLFYFGF